MLLAPDIPITASSSSYSNGIRGVCQTLAIMRDFVTRGKIDPAIIKAARAAVYLTPEKSPLHEVRTTFEFVRDNIRYVADVLGVETISEAKQTLLLRQGDCDDQVVLLCAMFEAIGYATRFVVAGYNDASAFDHVYCQVLIADDTGNYWIDCDPTEHNELGWMPPDPVSIAFEVV